MAGLTVSQIRAAKPANKRYKIYDGRGLFLLIHTNGGKYWRFRYQFNDKDKTIALGTYPELSLPEARRLREEYRSQVSKGIDPAVQKKARKQARREAAGNSFEVVAREWLAGRAWENSTRDLVKRRLEKDVFPWLGDEPISQIDAPTLLNVLRKAEARGVVYTAHRLRQHCSKVFRYAIATGRASRDPAADLVGALKQHQTTHYASITDPRQIGPLLRDIDAYWGTPVVRLALRLAPYVFVRPGNLRKSLWAYVDFQAREWRIPSSSMKKPAPHIIPMAPQVHDMLNELHRLSGRRSQYLFPNMRTAKAPMSENTINGALRRMGYDKDTLTGHGLRHMASTILHEQGFNSDAVERQLAHMDRDETRATYNYAQYMDERRVMMQSWADYLDELREKG